MPVTIRPAVNGDLPRIVEIYNSYVTDTPITFDVEPRTPEQMTKWFEGHNVGRRYRMFVAEENGQIIGFAGTGRFHDRPAYDTSVETTIYCARGIGRRGIGSMLYRALFDAIKDEDIHRIIAGITLPNDASLALHRKFGFTEVGVYREVGRKLGRYWDVMWMDRPLRLND
ncbi:MAG TPA: GNAT family N-acetyltransferase [Candidatus Binataceae bacterium]|nr:GNAT family N-acetyltransferase [Candidatus Binataceae bacterium]